MDSHPFNFSRSLPLTPHSVDVNASSSDKLARFYADTLGLDQIAGEAGSRCFTAGTTPILTTYPVTAHSTSAPPATGLYHLAILVPSRLDLAQVLRRLLEREVPLQGASDHGVSEALYFADPEGNGIEIYADRAPQAWPRKGSQIEMFTRRLDFDGVMGELRADGRPWEGMPGGTRLGHVHLKASDLGSAEAFYRDVIGFDLMLRFGDSASFLSTGGYHHHVGLNTWESLGRAAPAPGAPGLRKVTFTVGDTARLRSIEARATEAGTATDAQNGMLVLADPSGIQVALAIQSETGPDIRRQTEPAHTLEGAQPVP
jgi:catechol 2,3-dioxygenase